MNSPSPYRISTITSTGSLGCAINLEKLFANIDEVANSDNILYVEFGRRKFDNSYCKGQIKKVIQMGTKQKRFDNQVTVLYKDDTSGVYVSAKIFKNGNLQMTGIKSYEQGHVVMRTIRDIVLNAYSKDQDVIVKADDAAAAVAAQALADEPSNFSVRMINSDFKMGFPIRRDLLYKAWITEYGHGCSYEPCIYQGVKIQYFYKKNRDISGNVHDGICRCSTPCILRRKNEEVPCRKVTIAVFQSGSVIITGGQSIEQVEEVYEFIKGALNNLRPRIEDRSQTNAPEANRVEKQAAATTPQKVLLKKTNIIYPKSIIAMEK